MDLLAELMQHQSGIVSRGQLLTHGLESHDVRRLVRRRELRPVARGVYVDHTGDLTWIQTAWRAVLAVPGSALSHQSAVHAVAGPPSTGASPLGLIHLAVERGRSPAAPTGVRLHHLADLERKIVAASPPRVRVEEALLDLAAGARDEFAVIARLADAVQARLTTPDRLLTALEGRTRIRRSELLRTAIEDIATGTGSALEHGYLTRVERPHRLPVAQRQVRVIATAGTTYRDVDYRAYGLVVELDGRQFHDSAGDRDRDLDRDLDTALTGARAVRLGWGQVFRRSCETARKVGDLLALGGWEGEVEPCPACADLPPAPARTQLGRR